VEPRQTELIEIDTSCIFQQTWITWRQSNVQLPSCWCYLATETLPSLYGHVQSTTRHVGHYRSSPHRQTSKLNHRIKTSTSIFDCLRRRQRNVDSKVIELVARWPGRWLVTVGRAASIVALWQTDTTALDVRREAAPGTPVALTSWGHPTPVHSTSTDIGLSSSVVLVTPSHFCLFARQQQFRLLSHVYRAYQIMSYGFRRITNLVSPDQSPSVLQAISFPLQPFLYSANTHIFALVQRSLCQVPMVISGQERERKRERENKTNTYTSWTMVGHQKGMEGITIIAGHLW